MATKYLLPCECGEKIPVELVHSGEPVTCQCGRTQEIPPLRLLQKLEVFQQRRRPPLTAWTPRGARVMVFTLFTIIMLIFTGFVFQTRPRQTKIQTMSPVQTWALWTHLQHRVAFEPSQMELDEIATGKDYRRKIAISLALTGIGAVSTFLAFFLSGTGQERKPKRVRRRRPPQKG